VAARQHKRKGRHHVLSLERKEPALDADRMKKKRGGKRGGGGWGGGGGCFWGGGGWGWGRRKKGKAFQQYEKEGCSGARKRVLSLSPGENDQAAPVSAGEGQREGTWVSSHIVRGDARGGGGGNGRHTALEEGLHACFLGKKKKSSE